MGEGIGGQKITKLVVPPRLRNAKKGKKAARETRTKRPTVTMLSTRLRASRENHCSMERKEWNSSGLVPERSRINPSVASTSTNSMIGTNDGAKRAMFIGRQTRDV